MRPRSPATPRVVIALSLASACASSGVGLPPPEVPDRPPPVRPVASTSLGAVLDPRAAVAALAGHGDWFATPRYGTVWIPRAPRGFVPFVTDGGWVFTDAGWYWRSDLAWGAIPFHYGRWVDVDGSWAWAPGTAFAPAWVDWRAGASWVAWAPRSPRGASTRATFVFCAFERALGAGVSRRVVTGAEAASLFPRTAPIAPRAGLGGAVYANGPGAPPGARSAASLAATWEADLDALRSSSTRHGALALNGLSPAPPPTTFPSEPVCDEDPTSRDASLVDARAVVRLRDEDLARPGRAVLSVVNLPPGARAALFAPRRASHARAAAPPGLEDDVPELPNPLPPPADAPLAWWPTRGPRRVLPRVPVGLEAPSAAVAERLAPTTPLIGMPAYVPMPPSGVAVGQGLARGGVAIPMSTPSVATMPVIQPPVASSRGVAGAQVVGASSPMSFVR